MKAQKNLNLFFALTLFLSINLKVNAQISEAEKLYESGIYQLEAVGNFEEAIKIFNLVVKQNPENKPVAAKSLLKLGLCYERLGSQKAEEAYKQIIEKFPEQAKQVAEAKERLKALQQHNIGEDKTLKLNYDKEYFETNSLSYDGTKMAGTDFSQGQNIAYFDFVSKERKLVTHHNWDDAYTYYPIWSPGVKEIAYIKCGWKTSDPYSLWTSTLDGKARLLHSNPTPGFKIFPQEWLPNGKGVVAILQDSSGTSLAVISISGGPINILYKFEDNVINSASVSPDSKYILFSDGSQGKRDIRIINIETKEVSTFIENPADDSSPRWAPDSKHIVFKSNRHGDWAIWGVAVNGSMPMPEGPPFMTMSGAKDLRLLNWTPSGMVLNKVISSADIYKLQVDPLTGQAKGNPEQLNYSPTGSNFLPAWSPDSKQIVFSTQIREKRKVAIIVISADGRDSREFLLPPKCGPGILRWTPDGREIGFAGFDSTMKSTLFRLKLDSGSFEKWHLNLGTWTRIEWDKDGKSVYYPDFGVEGSQSRLIKRTVGQDEGKDYYIPESNEATFRSFKFSRDYSQLAFQQGSQIMLLDIKSGNLKSLTPEAAAKNKYGVPPVAFKCPSWSPDNKKIMAVKELTDEKTNQIFKMVIIDVANGNSEEINLGKSLPKDVQIREIDWSSDGKEVVFGTVYWIHEDQLLKTVIPKGH
jgi:Tol biopolymer transport system component